MYFIKSARSTSGNDGRAQPVLIVSEILTYFIKTARSTTGEELRFLLICQGRICSGWSAANNGTAQLVHLLICSEILTYFIKTARYKAAFWYTSLF